MLEPRYIFGAVNRALLNEFRTIVKRRNHYEFEARVQSCTKLCTALDEQRRNRDDFDVPPARRLLSLTALLVAYISTDMLAPRALP